MIYAVRYTQPNHVTGHTETQSFIKSASSFEAVQPLVNDHLRALKKWTSGALKIKEIVEINS